MFELVITIPSINDKWDEAKEEFVTIEGRTITLRHSLVSVSKWEAKWHKAFLSKTNTKTQEELIDYIRCMTLEEDVDPELYLYIPESEMERIQVYLEDSHTATTINYSNAKPRPGRDPVVTSEVMYYYMISLQIPFECENWHFERLRMLIQVCNELNKEAEQEAKSNGRHGQSRLSAKEQQSLAQRYHEIHERRKLERMKK